jgi:archaellum component FlaF (FlaF/FlaG flagellin family)
MEHSIPALLLASIIIVAGVLIAGVTNRSVNTVNDGWREMESISEERLGTDIAVVSTSVDGSGAEITALVRNDGRTQLTDFEHMDLIVSYDGSDAQRHQMWMPFDESAAQPDNTWAIVGIQNDYHNPGIVDTGEEMTIRIRVNPTTVAGPDRWLVLSTGTGVAYTVYF